VVPVEVKLGPLLPAPQFWLQDGFSPRLVDAYKRLPANKRWGNGSVD